MKSYHLIRRYFSRFADIFRKAIFKPGLNTLLLPYRLIYLLFLGVKYLFYLAKKHLRRKWRKIRSWIRINLTHKIRRSRIFRATKIIILVIEYIRKLGVRKATILVINDIRTLGIYKTILLIMHKIKMLVFEDRKVSEIRNDILRKRLTKVLSDDDWYEAYKIMRKYNMSVIDRIDLASMLPIFDYGSINKGKKEWVIKWKNATHDHRVLMVAPKDFAGSMYKLAESLNRYSDYAVRLITFDFHQFGYPLDLIVPECNGARMEALFKLASESAVLHLKDEHSWFLRWERSLNLEVIDKLFFSNLFKNTPKVFTHYGGYARKFKHHKKYVSKVKKFEGRITMTPDLNFDWYDGKYIPHTIDTDKIQSCWYDSNILVHSPSNPLTKATSLLDKAIHLLENNYQNL